MNRTTLDRRERYRVWGLVQSMEKHNPSYFHSVCLPYLMAFPHHFERPLVELKSIRALERAVDLLPHAQFALNLIIKGDEVRHASSFMNDTVLRHLHTLKINQREMLSEVLVVLLRGESPRFLSYLDCSHCVFDYQSMKLFLSSNILETVYALRLNYCRMDSATMLSLISSSQLSSLRVLMLEGNWIDEVGAQALAQAELLEQLEQLSLALNPIGERGYQAMRQSPYLSDAIRETFMLVGRAVL